MLPNTNIGDRIKTPKVLKAFSGQTAINAHQSPHHITLFFPKVADPSTWEDVLDRFETLGSDVLKMPEGNGIQMSRDTYERYIGPGYRSFFKPLFEEYPKVKRVTAKERQSIAELTGNPVIAVMNTGRETNVIALSGSVDGVSQRIEIALTTSTFEAFDRACRENDLSEKDVQNLTFAIGQMRHYTDPELANDVVRTVSKKHGTQMANAFFDAAEQIICPGVILTQHRPSDDLGLLEMRDGDYQRLLAARLG